MAVSRRPNIKAVIVSVYGTILEKMERQPDADARWQALWQERFGEPARLDLAALNVATDAEVDEVLSLARDLEQRALAQGYALAEAEHGLDEVLDTHSPRFTPPGPDYGSSTAR